MTWVSKQWYENIIMTVVCLSIGPTSFAPVIDAAVGIVERSNGQYHVLVIIADGQVLAIYVISYSIIMFSWHYLIIFH